MAHDAACYFGTRKFSPRARCTGCSHRSRCSGCSQSRRSDGRDHARKSKLGDHTEWPDSDICSQETVIGLGSGRSGCKGLCGDVGASCDALRMGRSVTRRRNEEKTEQSVIRWIPEREPLALSDGPIMTQRRFSHFSHFSHFSILAKAPESKFTSESEAFGQNLQVPFSSLV